MLYSHSTLIGAASIAFLFASCTASSPSTPTVQSYQECVDAGYTTESDPPSCKTPDGRIFQSKNENMNEDVQLTSIMAGDRVQSPLLLQGEARGSWFFEAILPANIEDVEGNMLAEQRLQAQENWMTTDFVSFSGTIVFDVSEETPAFLVIRKNNPSGLPENADAVRMSITLLPNTNKADSNIIIEQEFDGKILYGSQLNEAQQEEARKHCQTQGGTFNKCGSPCAPEAEACIQVCAYTCELQDESSIAMQVYNNKELGFRMHHPVEMNIEGISESPEGKGIRLTHWGPTQTEGTELFDGVSVTIIKGSTEEGVTLDQHTNVQLQRANEIGSVITPKHTTTLAGKQAFSYTVESLGIHTHYYLPIEDDTYLHIITLSPDPTSQGYNQWIQGMLASLEIT